MKLFDIPEAQHFCAPLQAHQPGTGQSLSSFHKGPPRRYILHEGTTEFEIHRVSLLNAVERWILFGVADYRRALDFMAERGEVDMHRIGLLGYSMGGMDSFYLLSVEPRIKMAVACVPPLLSIGYGPASPIDYSWGIGKTPFLMLMGRKDGKDDYVGKVEASYRKYIETPNTKLLWYDQGHKLTAIYVPDALAWIKKNL